MASPRSSARSGLPRSSGRKRSQTCTWCAPFLCVGAGSGPERGANGLAGLGVHLGRSRAATSAAFRALIRRFLPFWSEASKAQFGGAKPPQASRPNRRPSGAFKGAGPLDPGRVQARALPRPPPAHQAQGPTPYASPSLPAAAFIDGESETHVAPLAPGPSRRPRPSPRRGSSRLTSRPESRVRLPVAGAQAPRLPLPSLRTGPLVRQSEVQPILVGPAGLSGASCPPYPEHPYHALPSRGTSRPTQRRPTTVR